MKYGRVVKMCVYLSSSLGVMFVRHFHYMRKSESRKAKRTVRLPISKVQTETQLARGRKLDQFSNRFDTANTDFE